MISYIFKSKIKNILVSIFSILIICVNLNELYQYIIFGLSDSIILKFISIIPYLFIFIYMLTLKRDYKFKQFLFPTAFAIFTLTAIFSITNCFDGYAFLSVNGLVRLLFNLIIKSVLIAGCSFCFVGTLSNFKRIIFLRLGLPICITAILFQNTSYFINLLLSNRAANNLLNDLMGNEFFTYVSVLRELPRIFILLLFYISLFILALTKKSDNIDISPFIETRKLKKEIKKAKNMKKKIKKSFYHRLYPTAFGVVWVAVKSYPLIKISANVDIKDKKTAIIRRLFLLVFRRALFRSFLYKLNLQ